VASILKGTSTVAVAFVVDTSTVMAAFRVAFMEEDTSATVEEDTSEPNFVAWAVVVEELQFKTALGHLLEL
jgi:hypothetical protein